MAKKTAKPRSVKHKKGRRKKMKRRSPFFSSVKQLLIWACIIVVCFIGLLFLYNHFYPDPRTERLFPKLEQLTLPSSTGSSDKSSSDSLPPSNTVTKQSGGYTLTFPEDAELPRLRSNRNERVIRHEGYTVSYNSEYKIANWVAWELTEAEAKSTKHVRKNEFVPNPQLKGASAMREDYSKTGYDRGHMAPAGDMKWSEKAMRESFYYSNICPQHPGLNRGLWKNLEELCRLWAIENGDLLITCGPVITDDMKRLGKNRVGVPHRFYKVICMISENNYEGIAFVLENKDHENSRLQSYAVPIDSIERLTGIDFFFALPDESQRRMKSGIDWNAWSF